MPETLYTAQTAGKGLGVFTRAEIRVGETVLIFQGPLLCGLEVKDENRCIQIGPDRFLGPSGEFDDFVNHSCSPNCGLVSVEEGMHLIAIRNIAPGEEITFDYSTATNLGDHWSMPCRCQASDCRGLVQDFDTLPNDLKDRYMSQGIVPPYILLNGSGALRRRTTEFDYERLQDVSGTRGPGHGAAGNGGLGIGNSGNGNSGNGDVETGEFSVTLIQSGAVPGFSTQGSRPSRR